MTDSTIRGSFWLGVDQFNQHQFYACHDTLEALWMEALEPDKTFYQGILQVAVALYHLSNHNLRGATILLGEGINRLRRYEPDYAEINVSQFLITSSALLTLLQHTPPDQVQAIAAQLGLSSLPCSTNRSSLLPLLIPMKGSGE